MTLDLKVFLNILLHKNKENKIVSFRNNLTFVYHIFLAPAFILYAFIFLANDHVWFGIVKLIFGILLFLGFVIFKNKRFQNAYPLFLIFIFTAYSIISYLSDSEARYGFMWAFFVTPAIIFLMGYKQGSRYFFIYIFVMFFIGVFDVLNQKVQFEDFLSYSIFILALLLFSVICILVDFSYVKLHEKLTYISEIDHLTSLYNRRKIDKILNENNTDTLSIAILDIDDFKQINDKFGHQKGDVVLKKFAKTLKQNVRSTDMVGRWGGEEFIIIFPSTNIDDAFKCIQKIKNILKNLSFEEIATITCSFGISSADGKISLSELISKADAALYVAKKNGKDRIELAS